MSQKENEFQLITRGKKKPLIEVALREATQYSPDQPVSLKHIGESVGATRELARQVYQKLKKAGVKLPPKYKQSESPEKASEKARQHRKVKQLWDQGLMVKEIASKIGVEETTVEKITYRHRDEFCYRNLVDEASETATRAIKSLFNDGLTYEEIEGATGLTRSQVTSRIQKLQSEGELSCRRKHRNPSERGLFDLRIEALTREAELPGVKLTHSQMVTRLEPFHPDVKITDIHNAKQRLKEEGKITLESRPRRPATEIELCDLRVEALSRINLKPVQITEKLQETFYPDITRQDIYSCHRRLKEAGRIE